MFLLGTENTMGEGGMGPSLSMKSCLKMTLLVLCTLGIKLDIIVYQYFKFSEACKNASELGLS